MHSNFHSNTPIDLWAIRNIYYGQVKYYIAYISIELKSSMELNDCRSGILP